MQPVRTISAVGKGPFARCPKSLPHPTSFDHPNILPLLTQPHIRALSYSLSKTVSLSNGSLIQYGTGSVQIQLGTLAGSGFEKYHHPVPRFSTIVE